MIQHQLNFDVIDTVQRAPRSRVSNVEASHRAEQRMKSSGQMKSQAVEVLALVQRFPGRTSKELGRAIEINRIDTKLDRYRIARRLPELESAKLITRTDEDRESRWWAA